VPDHCPPLPALDKICDQFLPIPAKKNRRIE